MRILLAIAAALLAACTSTTTVDSKPVEGAGGAISGGRRAAEAHTSLAGEYYQRGNFSIALGETRLAVKDDPTYVAAYNMQALIYMELREDGQAREAFEKALSMQPNNAETLNNYGWFLCVRNDDKRGMDLIHRAINDPLYQTPEKAYLSAGLCLRRTGRNAEAEDYLRRAVLIRPDLIGALFNLAVINYEKGDLKQAENYLVRYARLTTPNAEALVIGVKIARAINDKVAEDSFMQQLRRRFPDSNELRELEKR